MATLERLNYPEAELVFGIVAAVGTDLGRFCSDLTNQLQEHGYTTEEVRLSRLIRSSLPGLPTDPEYLRISAHMSAGTKLRKRAKSGSVLALLAASKIASGRPNKAGQRQPVARRAYVLNSLKHPEEVTALRKIYGSGFFLIGVYDREEDRLSHLANALHMTRSEASKLVERDQDEGEIFGQRTRDTFHLADAFVRFRAEDLPNKELGRFLDLVFGCPFHTPTSDEHAMFLAFSSALRSADLSRQVGAVIVSKEGDVLAVGANDVPRSGGGLYWPLADDQRDHILGFDSNEALKTQLAKDVIGVVSKGKKVNKGVVAKAARLLALTEFGRAAHAEMEAIIACARNSGAREAPRCTQRHSLVTTARNTSWPQGSLGLSMSSPIPKSKALELHHDSISLYGQEQNKVAFEPFVGIGPRRYFDLFSLALGSGREIERKKDGRKKDWDRTVPKIQMAPVAYIAREASRVRS